MKRVFLFDKDRRTACHCFRHAGAVRRTGNPHIPPSTEVGDDRRHRPDGLQSVPTTSAARLLCGFSYSPSKALGIRPEGSIWKTMGGTATGVLSAQCVECAPVKRREIHQEQVSNRSMLVRVGWDAAISMFGSLNVIGGSRCEK